MIRGCSNRGVAHAPSGCETLLQRVVLNFSGSASRLIFGGRKSYHFGEGFCNHFGGDFVQKNFTVCRKATLIFQKKKQNLQFGGKFLGCNFRANSGVVNPVQIWGWIPHPENATDSQPHFQRMPLIMGVNFQANFCVKKTFELWGVGFQIILG